MTNVYVFHNKVVRDSPLQEKMSRQVNATKLLINRILYFINHDTCSRSRACNNTSTSSQRHCYSFRTYV